VLLRQRPGSAKGVIFMTLEDEAGAANIIVWPKTFERFRKEVLTGRMLIVSGKLQREGLVIHLIADRIVDATAMLGELTAGEFVLEEVGMARADEGRTGVTTEQRLLGRQREEDRRARAEAILPRSRDFH
jgi:error-prone DNA polymerase